MRRRSGRRLNDKKIYKYKGKVQKFDYSTQKLGDEYVEVYCNLLSAPNITQFKYKGTIGINNSSEFQVEAKCNYIISPEDRFYLQDGTYGKVISNRLINMDKDASRARKNKLNKNTWYEQIIDAG